MPRCIARIYLVTNRRDVSAHCSGNHFLPGNFCTADNFLAISRGVEKPPVISLRLSPWKAKHAARMLPLLRCFLVCEPPMQISSIASYLAPTAAKSSNASKTDGDERGFGSRFCGRQCRTGISQIRKDVAVRSAAREYLEQHGIAGGDLKSLSPAELRAVEQKISEMVEQQLHKNPTQTGQLMDVSGLNHQAHTRGCGSVTPRGAVPPDGSAQTYPFMNCRKSGSRWNQNS